MKLLVLDGNSILNRAFYGIKILTTKDGAFTNGIYGFLNILLKLEEQEKPDEVAVAFDLPAPTFRHRMYDGYKAKRKGMPEELAQQLPVLKELLADLGYALVTAEGYEADDILGTLSAAAEARGDACVLATGDRDSLQLVRPGVDVLLTTTVYGKGETTRMDEAAVREKYGVAPAQLVDIKALQGDASDNIPGVPGVGEKTASGLVAQFGSLDGVYENLDDASIKPGLRQKLADGKDLAYLSEKLGTIDCAAPVDAAPGAYVKAPAGQKAGALLAKLEMYSLIPKFGLDAAAVPPAGAGGAPKKAAKADVADLPQGLSGVFYVAEHGGDWYVVPAGARAQTGSTCGIYRAPAQADLFGGTGAFLAFLADSACEKRVFDAKPLHRIALADGGAGAKNITFDAKLAAYLLNPAASDYTVARLAPEYGVHPAFTCDAYPEAGVLEGLFTRLAEDCETAEMTKLLTEMEQPLAEVLASMELTGVAVDAAGIRAFGGMLQKEMTKQLESVYDAVGYTFNLNSPKQLGEALFTKLALPHGKKTKSGWSTDAKTLEGLRGVNPVVDTILQYRLYQKLNSTYVEAILKVIGPDGRVHSTFNQTEARTGRLSSNEPNLQNIPVRTELGSRFRKYFVAENGCSFADADYSQIELRILAAVSNDEAMQADFLKNVDIHRATAARVHNIPLDEVTPAMRTSAKAVNFGIVYGIGAFSLSHDIGVTVKEAEQFIKTYLDKFPGVKRYMEDSVAFGKEHGYVKTLFGRRRPVPELASSNYNIRSLGERIAMNTPIQGSAADIIKLAMIRVWRRLRGEGLQSRLVLQVHDELIVEAPDGELARAEAILQEEMQGAAALAVPLLADVHAGKNWLDAKG